MKKIINIIIASFLFIACVPTPNEDFIVNKGDSIIQSNGQQSDNDEHFEIKRIPSYVARTEHPQDHVTVEINADVEIDRNSSFPIIEVLALDTVEDPAFCSKMLSALCPNGTIYKRWERTKSEIQEELVAAMSYNGQAGSLVDIDQDYIQYLENAYRNAPESAERIEYDATKGYKKKSDYYISNSDGTISILSFGNTINEGVFCDDYSTMYYTEDYLEKGDTPLSYPTITEEDAITIATTFLNSLGMECYSMVGTERGFAFSATLFERKDTVWWIHFVRKIGASNSIDMRDVRGYQYPANPSSVLGSPWAGIESIHVVVGENGIRYVQWEGLTEVRKILQQDTTFYDFDGMIARAIAQFGYQYTNPESNENLTICVQRISLVYGVLSEKDHRDTGVYMPIWELTYRIKNDPTPLVWKFYISALDGGTVEPRITTDSLIQESMNP